MRELFPVFLTYACKHITPSRQDSLIFKQMSWNLLTFFGTFDWLILLEFDVTKAINCAVNSSFFRKRNFPILNETMIFLTVTFMFLAYFSVILVTLWLFVQFWRFNKVLGKSGKPMSVVSQSCRQKLVIWRHHISLVKDAVCNCNQSKL